MTVGGSTALVDDLKLERDDRGRPPTRRASRSFWVALGVIAVVAFGVRAWWVLVGDRHFRPGPDALYYHLQGLLIGSGHWFINPLLYFYPVHGHPALIQQPGADHPPLYGMYLGLVSWLHLRSLTAHRLASCLLGTGAVVAIGLTGRKLAGERVGLIAASIAAVYANLWINDGILLSESLTALLVALMLLAAYSWWRRPTRGNAVWLGVAFGSATLTRPEVLLLAPLLALPLVLLQHDLALRRRVETLLICAVFIVVLVGPWVGFNLTRFHHPVLLTSTPSAVVAAGSCDATYHGKLLGWYASCPALSPTQPLPRGGDVSDHDLAVRHAAFKYVRTHIGRFPIVALARVGRLWDVYRPGQTRELNATTLELRTRGASRVAQISSWLLFPLAIAGAIVLRRRRVPISPLVAPAILVTIAAALFIGAVRYRLSAEPALILAAAVSLDVLWTSMVVRHRRAVADG